MRDDNNPRAFPSIAIDDKCGGMQLRDYFAGQALAGICAHTDSWGLSTDEKIAQAAYALARAMLDEREGSRPRV